MKTNKRLYLTLTFLLAGILMLGNVLAFAVSSMYWEENPITINPGETKQAYIVLQNMAGTETVNARVGISQGSEIAIMNNPDMIYEIPVGQKTQVNFTITVPADTEIGGDYNVVFDISTITQQGTGPMSFGSGAQKLIPVLITEKPKPEKTTSAWIYYLITGIILLVIVALAVLKANKKK
ncbi:MAG: hypothetical protein NTZ83_06200 [Candidatus Pacearchaeota archaeon]|nr:hypothetical protein [Candidatus Pacearchaeota archaeon]